MILDALYPLRLIVISNTPGVWGIFSLLLPGPRRPENGIWGQSIFSRCQKVTSHFFCFRHVKLNDCVMGDKQELKRKVKRMHDEISEEKEKRKVLKEMELFVLDNSLRESTVGQLRGHTIENKWKIYEQVKVLFYFETRIALNIFKDVYNSATLPNGQSSFSLGHLSNRPSTSKRLYSKSKCQKRWDH